ncbi:hypothetical protein RV03_GL001201 [Enterococcus gallinarum]|nr:hypothetical protein RV03_GL001201 [Enterococcus gallinarum]
MLSSFFDDVSFASIENKGQKTVTNAANQNNPIRASTTKLLLMLSVKYCCYQKMAFLLSKN